MGGLAAAAAHDLGSPLATIAVTARELAKLMRWTDHDVRLADGSLAARVAREALQIHGGMGYAEEFPVSRYFVDARVLSIFEGADELLAFRVIVPRLTERPRT